MQSSKTTNLPLQALLPVVIYLLIPHLRILEKSGRIRKQEVNKQESKQAGQGRSIEDKQILKIKQQKLKLDIS